MATQEERDQLKKDFEELERLASRLGKTIDLSNVKRDANAVKELLKAWRQELNDLNSEFTNLQDTFKNVVEDLGKANRTSIDVNRSFRTLGGIADKLKYDAEDIADLNKKDLVSLQSKAKVEISSLALQRKRLEEEFKSYSQQELIAAEQQKENKALAKRAAQLLELRSIIEVNGELIKDENNYMAELLKLLDERIKKEDKISNSVGGVAANLIKGLGKIPIIGDLLDIEGAQKAMRTAAKDGASSFNQLKLGFGALGNSLSAALGPLALITFAVKAFKTLVEVMFAADKQVTSIARNLSVSKEEAADIRSSFNAIATASGLQYNRLQDIIDAQIQLSELSKFTILFSATALENQVALTKEIGLSESEAANLNKTFSLNNAEGSKGRKIIYDRIAAFANENKYIANGRKILQEVSKISGQILLNFRGNLPALADAVLQAEQLGVSLSDARNISNSLLDFESSINNELEAGVFLGRRFNLEQARSLALQKNYVGATQEVLKQVGSIEEFQSMSAIHQQVIAKAANMTVDELSESLMYQQYLNDEQKQQYDRFKAAGREDIAQRLAAGKIKSEELEKAQRSLDAQEKFNIALDKAKEIFTSLVTGGTLDSLSVLLKNIIDSLAYWFGDEEKIAKIRVEAATDIVGDIQNQLESGNLSPEQQKSLLKRLKEQQEILKEELPDVKEDQRVQGMAATLSKAPTSEQLESYYGGVETQKLANALVSSLTKSIQSKSEVPTTQKIQDGVSLNNDGPFEITNRYGQTAVTAVGDKIAVSPNISINRQPTQPTSVGISKEDVTAIVSNLLGEFNKGLNAITSRPSVAIIDGRDAFIRDTASNQNFGTYQGMNTSYLSA